MIWAILASLGLCGIIAFLKLLLQNRGLRNRPGDLLVYVREPGKKRWTRSHAIWVSDVFAFRGSPAAWEEDLIHVEQATIRAADAEEHKKLHRMGDDDPAIATLTAAGGEILEVAVPAERRSALLGPFAAGIETPDRNGARAPVREPEPQ